MCDFIATHQGSVQNVYHLTVQIKKLPKVGRNCGAGTCLFNRHFAKNTLTTTLASRGGFITLLGYILKPVMSIDYTRDYMHYDY